MAYIDNVTNILQIQPDGLPTFVRLSQNENGRNLYFQLAGNEIDIPANATITISGTKPDGTVYSGTGSISNNVILIPEMIQMTAVAGYWDAKVKIISGGNTIATGRIRFVVDADTVDSDSVPSDSELEGLVAEAQQYAETARTEAYGSPLTATAASGMTDHTRVYVYTGSETGYTYGHWYFWNGSAWTDGGIYNSTATNTDPTLTLAGVPADAKATGDKITSLKEELNESVTTKNYVEGKNLDSTTGALVDEDGTCVSDWIPYTWTGIASYDCGDNTKPTYRIEFYDAEKNHLSGFRNPSSTGNVTYRGINAETQVTGTVGFVRFSFKNGTVGKVFANAQTNYWIATSITVKGVFPSIGNLNNLDTTNKDNLVDAINEVAEEIPDISFPITPSDTNFFYVSPNLADPLTFVENEFVNQTNGVFTSYNGHTRTNYIPVVAGQKYCIINSTDYNTGIRYVFYNSNKEYISGAAANLNDIGNIITAPANSAYLVMSGSTVRFPFMVAESDTKISYIEYGETYLLPQYVLGEDISNIPINLPSKIYALVGYELNIYYDALVEDWSQYNFNVSCSKGMDMKRGYRITPTELDVGTYPLTITVSTKDYKSSKSVSTTLVVTSASAGNGENLKIIILGDSTTNSGYAVTHFKQNFADDVMDITLEGTRGTLPYLHEGRSGWTFQYYFSTAGSGSVLNPWYNPDTQTFDANYYFTETGITKPDWFFINLGINDTFSYTSDTAVLTAIETIKGYCDAMIASVKSAVPNIKIGLCITIPPNQSQDAFGKAYNCDQTRNRYKRNNVIWANSLIEEYDNQESDSIYLIPIYTNLDTVYNMGLETLPVNARNTTVTYESPIANGGIHPVESGYWQIADVYTAFIKAYASD